MILLIVTAGCGSNGLPDSGVDAGVDAGGHDAGSDAWIPRAPEVVFRSDAGCESMGPVRLFGPSREPRTPGVPNLLWTYRFGQDPVAERGTLDTEITAASDLGITELPDGSISAFVDPRYRVEIDREGHLVHVEVLTERALRPLQSVGGGTLLVSVHRVPSVIV